MILRLAVLGKVPITALALLPCTPGHQDVSCHPQ
jgi:hypothetical protein